VFGHPQRPLGEYKVTRYAHIFACTCLAVQPSMLEELLFFPACLRVTNYCSSVDPSELLVFML